MRVCVYAGQGVEPAPFDPAIVVVFVTIPGVGKTYLCQKLLETLDRNAFEVVHCHGDAMTAGEAPSSGARRKGGNYWTVVADAVATRRGDGRTTLVLADKNLIDSPLGIPSCPRSSFVYVTVFSSGFSQQLASTVCR